jgi:hypothetical protein
VEVVLALALIIAIGSLVLPALDAGPAQWREAQRAVSMATVEARAMAMHLGRPTQLIAHAGAAGVELRAGAVVSTPDGGDASGPPRSMGEVLGALPTSVSIVPGDTSSQGPELDVEFATEASVPSPRSRAAAVSSSGKAPAVDVVLLTILPGGQVTLAPGWQLVAGARHALPKVNTWTGEVSFEDVPAAAAESPSAAEVEK